MRNLSLNLRTCLKTLGASRARRIVGGIFVWIVFWPVITSCTMIDRIGPVGGDHDSAGQVNSRVILGYGTQGKQETGGGTWAPNVGVVATVGSPSEIPVGEVTALGGDLGTSAHILEPSHFGHYCSVTWSDGGWAAAWYTMGHDPCGWIREHSDPGGQIQRAGMFDAVGVNRVVGRCGGKIYLFEGIGTGPLEAAFNQMVEDGLPSCVIVAAPREFPFAKSPFLARHADNGEHQVVADGSGFDFEMDTAPPDYDIDPSGWFTRMNNRGDWKLSGSPDDHKGNDFGAPAGTMLYPVASGEIFALNNYTTKGCADPTQQEVYIEHTVLANPTLYSEKFLSYYAHVVFDTSLGQGQSISDDETFGEVAGVGAIGCGSGPHIHFGIMKVTNTTWLREATINAISAHDAPCGSWPWACGESYSGKPFTFESYGYYANLTAGKEFDPYSWRGDEPWGAISSNIWIEGLAPPQDAAWFD